MFQYPRSRNVLLCPSRKKTIKEKFIRIMVFTSPAWVPEIGCKIPTSIPVGQFVLEGRRSTLPQPSDKAAFLCAVSGKSYSIQQLEDCVESLAKSLCNELEWSPNRGSSWDKVIGIFCVNTVSYQSDSKNFENKSKSTSCWKRKIKRQYTDLVSQIEFFILCWAIHRLNGTCLLLHSTSSCSEILSHMKLARCKTIFTCSSLLPVSLQVADDLALAPKNIYILDTPECFATGTQLVSGFKCLQTLIVDGAQLDSLEKLHWTIDQGARQAAYLCATSGTSGKQVGTS